MKKQIRNIVFDMGKVLIQFDPELYMDKTGIQDEDDRKIILKEIYHSPLWTDMDMGILNEDQMCEIVTPVLPEHLRKHVKDLISGWCVPLVSIEGMDELVSELKKKGYGLYLLSNASVMQKKYWPTYNKAELFDGTVVSAFEHVMKPDEKIYTTLLERYDLKAEECLFIDDRQNNLDTAKRLHMDTFLFNGNAKDLRDHLNKHIW